MKFVAVALLVALASAGCIKNKGWSYCKTTSKCGHGYGDCDKHSECKTGLKCVSSNSKYPQLWKWPYDCCLCPKSTGSGGWHDCSVNCKCGEKQGDCDHSNQCKTGLTCRSSGVNQAIGGSAKDYCCKPNGHWHSCTTGNCRCNNGEGDCDNDSQCLPGLKCLSGIAGQGLGGHGKDVCTKIVNKGWSGCRKNKKCGQGEGDCDGNHECKPGHVCVSTKNGQKLSGSAIDVCVKKLLIAADEDMEGADAADMDEAAVAEAVDEDEGVEPTEDDAAVETTDDAADVESDAVEQEDELVDEE